MPFFLVFPRREKKGQTNGTSIVDLQLAISVVFRTSAAMDFRFVTGNAIIDKQFFCNSCDVVSGLVQD